MYALFGSGADSYLATVPGVNPAAGKPWQHPGWAWHGNPARMEFFILPGPMVSDGGAEFKACARGGM